MTLLWSVCSCQELEKLEEMNGNTFLKYYISEFVFEGRIIKILDLLFDPNHFK